MIITCDVPYLDSYNPSTIEFNIEKENGRMGYVSMKMEETEYSYILSNNVYTATIDKSTRQITLVFLGVNITKGNCK
jgi:hypothetical protein